MVKVDVISGFLGAGKTTLIKKLIKEAYKGENLVNITGKLNIIANNATAKNLNVNNGNGNGAYINAKNVTVDGVISSR